MPTPFIPTPQGSFSPNLRISNPSPIKIFNQTLKNNSPKKLKKAFNTLGNILSQPNNKQALPSTLKNTKAYQILKNKTQNPKQILKPADFKKLSKNAKKLFRVFISIVKNPGKFVKITKPASKPKTYTYQKTNSTPPYSSYYPGYSGSSNHSSSGFSGSSYTSHSNPSYSSSSYSPPRSSAYSQQSYTSPDTQTHQKSSFHQTNGYTSSSNASDTDSQSTDSSSSSSTPRSSFNRPSTPEQSESFFNQTDQNPFSSSRPASTNETRSSSSRPSFFSFNRGFTSSTSNSDTDSQSTDSSSSSSTPHSSFNRPSTPEQSESFFNQTDQNPFSSSRPAPTNETRSSSSRTSSSSFRPGSFFNFFNRPKPYNPPPRNRSLLTGRLFAVRENQRQTLDTWLRSSLPSRIFSSFQRGVENLHYFPFSQRKYTKFNASRISTHSPAFQIFREFHPAYSDSLSLADLTITGSQNSLANFLNFRENGSSFQHLQLLSNIRRERNQNIGFHQALGQEVPPKVVIIGQGVGGLFAALEAYKEGATVTRVEKRDSISRDQILRLNLDTYHYLRRNFGDSLILEMENRGVIKRRTGVVDYDIFNLEQPNTFNNRDLDDFIIIETRDLELLVSSVLDALEQSDHNKQDKGLSSYQGYAISGLSENPETNEWSCHLKSGSNTIQVKADYLVGADGANSKTRELASIDWKPISTTSHSGIITFPNFFAAASHSSHILNTTDRRNLDNLRFFCPQVLLDGAKTTLIESGKLEDSEVLACTTPRSAIRDLQVVLEKEQKREGYTTERIRLAANHPSHLGTSDTERVIEAELSLVQEGQKTYLSSLKDIGWDLDRAPINRLFFTEHTIYLGTDVPGPSFQRMQAENKLDISQRHLQLDYFKKVLDANFPRYITEMLLPHTRNSFVFESTLNVAEKSFKRLGQNEKGLAVFLIGDANATPQFQTGSGAQKAIKDARNWRSLLKFSHKLINHSKDETFHLRQYIEETAKNADLVAQKAFKLGVVDKLDQA